MHEVDTVAKATHHAHKVVLAGSTQRTCAEAKAIARVGHGIHQTLEVFSRREDTWQAKDRHGRIVGMNDQTDSCFVGHGTNFAEEADQVAAQTLGVDALVAVEFMLELVERKR